MSEDAKLYGQAVDGEQKPVSSSFQEDGPNTPSVTDEVRNENGSSGSPSEMPIEGDATTNPVVDPDNSAKSSETPSEDGPTEEADVKNDKQPLVLRVNEIIKTPIKIDLNKPSVVDNQIKELNILLREADGDPILEMLINNRIVLITIKNEFETALLHKDLALGEAHQRIITIQNTLNMNGINVVF